MKKVAIVTPEALAPRSFLWDEVAERFKVRVNNVVENSLVQEEDGLYVFGDGSVQPSANNVGRVRLSNGKFDLPHFTISLISGDETANIEIRPKVSINRLSIQKVMYPEVLIDEYYQLGQGNTYRFLVDTTFRISHGYQDNIVVMDVFLIWGDPHDGFVDIIINAKTTDFPATGDGDVIVETPELV